MTSFLMTVLDHSITLIIHLYLLTWADHWAFFTTAADWSVYKNVYDLLPWEQCLSKGHIIVSLHGNEPYGWHLSSCLYWCKLNLLLPVHNDLKVILSFKTGGPSWEWQKPRLRISLTQFLFVTDLQYWPLNKWSWWWLSLINSLQVAYYSTKV